jgi:hypothetical protein
MAARRKIELEQWKARLSAVLRRNTARGRQRSTAKREPLRGVVDATQAVMTVLYDDCASFVEGAARQTGHLLSGALQRRATARIWLPSFITLGAADVALSTNTFARSAKCLGIVGAVGGAGLVVSSATDLWHAETAEEVLDATGDLAWGVQGISYLTAAPATAVMTAGLGFVGAVVQMSAGLLRITQGIRVRDPHTVKLGTLDVGGGMLWAALDVASWGNPLVLGTYVVLMVGREAYASKEALRKSWRSPPRLLRAANGWSAWTL